MAHTTTNNAVSIRHSLACFAVGAGLALVLALAVLVGYVYALVEQQQRVLQAAQTREQCSSVAHLFGYHLDSCGRDTERASVR